MLSIVFKILLSVGLAVFYTLAETKAHIDGEQKHLWETIAKAAFYLPLVYLIFELVHVTKKLGEFDAALKGIGESLVKAFEAKIDELTREVREVTNDQRIIFARTSSRFGKAISVIGIEEVSPVPEPLDQKPRFGEKWIRSLSILRFDRIQDLLFSEGYLRHYFALRKSVENQYRILIVNDTPRSVDAVYAFLQISEGFGIPTFVYLKSEFYGMLEIVSAQCQPEADATVVREILAGNPEINLMVEDNEFRNWLKASQKESDFLLRYLSQSGHILTRDVECRDLTHRQVLLSLLIMSAAMRDARRGRRAFDNLLASGHRPENFWSEHGLTRIPWRS